MDHLKEELQQISTWCTQEGLDPDAPEEAQLCFLWRAHRHVRSRLSTALRELDVQHAGHLAEMAEVCKSLEQIRNFTEQKNVLALEIQDENDQLKDQLQRFISLQDAQLSEVAKMLYQQGLTELVHCSPSEQVAYLLVERDSLLETEENQDVPTAGSPKAGSPLTSHHKGAPRLGQSPWKRLFGLHRTCPNKPSLTPEGNIQATTRSGGLEKQCSRLERDLEEGSRRLAMAHNEIRRLTDQLDSAHLTQRTYEPELQKAQQQVEQLRQEVGKLKKYEIVELRKAKELNDRLESEVRALRSRQGALTSPDDGEESKEVERLESLMNQHQKELQILQLEAKRSREEAQSQAAELMQSNRLCRDLENKLNEVTRKLAEKESEKLQQTLVQTSSRGISLNPKTTSQGPKCQDQEEAQNNGRYSAPNNKRTAQKDASLLQTELHEECPSCRGAAKTLLATREECESLKREICQTLQSLDKERSKYHEKTEKHKVKLSRLMQKTDEDTRWRDEKIERLEREASLCSHSLVKEKELVTSITMENEKLLEERRRLLQQLSEEQHNSSDSQQAAALAKRRVDFLELENKNLGKKILHMSDQLSALERRLHGLQPPKFITDLKNTHTFFNSSVKIPEFSKPSGSSVTNPSVGGDQAAALRSAEAGYLNLTSALSPSERSADEKLCSHIDLNQELETC
ncbi:myosin-7B isoform X2 [Synchiropus splendidus]|uniref:myosin-7B isoform X2 n=1 Tax=Synchiropus splendidus TaxID=270530 RepID=UPI00237D4436|nr:myosin-7B isoform X2 [Synchiropus splendidus]